MTSLACISGLRRYGSLAACAAILFAMPFRQFAEAAGPGEPVWLAGLAKVDITPKEPVRLSGYGNRNLPSAGVDSPLSVRCLAFRKVSDAVPPGRAVGESVQVLLSVDTIGLSGALTREMSQRLLENYGVRRERLVLASTHTHCGPDLVSGLANIFSTPLSDSEREAGIRYRERVVEAVVEAVGLALADLRPARLAHGSGEVKFAANRRVLKEGRWSGFGVQPDGVVDHSLPILRVTDPEGKLRGVVYNYACHCTTLGGDHNRINGDWSGFASETLEAKYPGFVALSTIGCGADANPEPRGTFENAVTHGKVMAAEVERVLSQPLRDLVADVDSKVDHAALSFELPTIEEVREKIEGGKTPQVRRHAANLDSIYREEGRLPATYPVPIQAWRFGDQLTMIFLGGEVVVDYARRLKRELADDSLWVTAYAGDVLGYIASERMRKEGGYEFDASTVYYNLPGPWAAGTEDNLISQVLSLLRGDKPQSPIAPEDALGTMRLSSDQYRIELVAAEPLVQDPINIAFGADGRLWVVEMGDYPRGERGGRIKYLEDTTGDGKYDRATVFLDQLAFPTGVMPWRDGVLLTVAPDILFARDTDGDGRADQVESIYSGFKLANPQHRVSGFAYGLDHSLHCAAGDNQGEIKSLKTGQVINASGRDIQIWPDAGGLATTSGRTQFMRSRDDWGQWFGSDNSRPMYHYPVDAAYLSRNPAVNYDNGQQQLFDPPVAPPVFPATSAAVRYNDLYAANRFTSACSSILSRSPHFDVGGLKAAFICEPVHNLVHRALLIPQGASYRAGRAAIEQDREFLASTDPWFRPVRAEIGPDGALWVVDMYRQTIEHPEWIPQAWQTQLDLYAGGNAGRIYRIVPHADSTPLPGRIDRLGSAALVELLRSPFGPLRDTAARLLVERASSPNVAEDPSGWVAKLGELADQPESAFGRVQALSLLEVLGKLDPSRIVAALKADDPGVLLVAVRLAESHLATAKGDAVAADPAAELLAALAPLADHADPRVVLAVALAMGNSDAPVAGQTLARIASSDRIDTWTRTAILSSAAPHADVVLAALLDRVRQRAGEVPEATLALISGLLDTAVKGGQDVVTKLRAPLAEASGDAASVDVRFSLAVSIAGSIDKIGDDSAEARALIEPIYRESLGIAVDDSQPEFRRLKALELFGRGLGDLEAEQAALIELLSPQVPVAVQRRAIAVLANLDRDGFVDFVVQRWPAMTASLRNDCVNRILSRQAWIGEWLAVLEAGTVGVNELSAAARQQLLHSGSRSMMVRAQRLIESPTGSLAKQELVQAYLTQFAASDEANGSPLDGAALYTQHCGACHTPDDQGRTIGPSLANLSDRRDRALVEAILNPNLAVDPKYQSYQLRTRDDEILVGAIESEVGETIALAKSDGTRVLVDRARVEELKNSGVSLMPEGFENLLSPAQLEAIVRHIQKPAG